MWRTARALLLELALPTVDCRTPVKLPPQDDPISPFFSVTRPVIAASDYIDRIMRYTRCSGSAFIYAAIYCARLAAKDARLAINGHNFHRVLMTAVVIAAKFVEDQWFSNSHYARVGGIATCAEMNRLELTMLALIECDLLVPLELFHTYTSRAQV